MAKDDKPRDLMGYDALQQEALRGVVKAALARVAPPRGLPGDHHFYISFRTDADMVSVPEDLLARYPEEMTIVLQNQFWDLKPSDNAFAVTLQFSGQPKTLTIPYSAITRFYDPSVQYLLQFSPPPPTSRPAQLRREETKAAAPRAAEGDGPKIVSLDQFRKK
ncbi:MAG: stringent starvation protein B [Caulobacteraceae bacterium]|nr:stringent starvation protein B [Caulobacteraceae bacterium]